MFLILQFNNIKLYTNIFIITFFDVFLSSCNEPIRLEKPEDINLEF